MISMLKIAVLSSKGKDFYQDTVSRYSANRSAQADNNKLKVTEGSFGCLIWFRNISFDKRMQKDRRQLKSSYAHCIILEIRSSEVAK